MFNLRDVYVEIRSFISVPSDVYGRSPELPMSETTSLDPDTWYGLSKSTSEWIVREESNANCPTCILRLPGIFGRSPKDRSVIGRIDLEHREGGKLMSMAMAGSARLRFCSRSVPASSKRLVARKAGGDVQSATGSECFRCGKSSPRYARPSGLISRSFTCPRT